MRIYTEFEDGLSRFPLCGVTICGLYPRQNNIAKVFGTTLRNTSKFSGGDVNYPMAGQTASSERKYQEFNYVDYSEFSSVIEGAGKAEQREIQYIRCNEILSGQYPEAQNTAKVFESDIETNSSNEDGESSYPMCGEVRCKGVNEDENLN